MTWILKQNQLKRTSGNFQYDLHIYTECNQETVHDRLIYMAYGPLLVLVTEPLDD